MATNETNDGQEKVTIMSTAILDKNLINVIAANMRMATNETNEGTEKVTVTTILDENLVNAIAAITRMVMWQRMRQIMTKKW